MQLATTDGVNLHVRELGEGPPVVMLHGLVIGSMMTWYFSAAPRLSTRFRVILFDLRGHGKSEMVKHGYDLSTMCNDLQDVVDQIARAPVVLVGHSFGALVALRFAGMRPDRVTKLVLVDAPLAPAHDIDAFLGQGLDGMAEALPLPLRRSMSEDGRRSQRFADRIRFFAKTSLLDDLRKMDRVADSELAAIRCPTLAVYGADSICKSGGARIAAQVAGAAVVELAGGHFLPIDAPNELGDLIERFIDG
jgi:pimeloyl-ACP methyl ester carboxylesterase